MSTIKIIAKWVLHNDYYILLQNIFNVMTEDSLVVANGRVFKKVRRDSIDLHIYTKYSLDKCEDVYILVEQEGLHAGKKDYKGDTLWRSENGYKTFKID